MIKVEKNFADVPTILKEQSREDAFNDNVSSASYCDAKNRYKIKSIQKKLIHIYHCKCAYCERSLLDVPKHIEHYRPKDTYYWLAYSWDNLLLCCGSCNSAKGNRFAIANDAVTYNRECFTDIHSLGTAYNDLENPKIINPEIDDVLDLIVFDKEGKVSSADGRVQHTIQNACNLNREELVQKRLEIITDFINVMYDHYLYFLKYKDASRFLPDIENFIQNCRVENEFYAFRYFVLNNVEIFFENNILQKIIHGRYEKYNDH